MDKDNTSKLKEAWLMTWKFNAQNENSELKKNGIEDKIIDIISAYKDFDYIIEYTKSVYKLLVADYNTKISLAQRGKNRMKDEDFFISQPILNSYHSEIYQELVKSQKKDGSKQYKKNIEKWKKYPTYINIGHNPSIYTRKVFNLSYDGENIKWEELTVNSELKKFSYKKTD